MCQLVHNDQLVHLDLESVLYVRDKNLPAHRHVPGPQRAVNPLRLLKDFTVPCVNFTMIYAETNMSFIGERLPTRLEIQVRSSCLDTEEGTQSGLLAELSKIIGIDEAAP